MVKMYIYIYRRFLLLLLSFATLILFSSCAKSDNLTLPSVIDYEKEIVAENKTLKLGVVLGPYGDMFKYAIEPFLVEKGYSVELVYYNDYIQPNIALANHEIDLNMFQHYKYLNNIKLEYDLALSSITEIPTASMGIFSLKYDSLYTLDNDIIVAIPSDNTNLARALQVLEAAGLVIINPSIDKSKTTINDLINNPYNIQFFLSEAKNLVNSLDSCDMSVINGNYALDGGLNLSDALYNEALVDGYINVIATRTSDLNSQFVTDLIDIVYSDAYKQAILQNDMYDGFQLPLNFFDTDDWRIDE